MYLKFFKNQCRFKAVIAICLRDPFFVHSLCMCMYVDIAFYEGDRWGSGGSGFGSGYTGSSGGGPMRGEGYNSRGSGPYGGKQNFILLILICNYKQ